MVLQSINLICSKHQFRVMKEEINVLMKIKSNLYETVFDMTKRYRNY